MEEITDDYLTLAVVSKNRSANFEWWNCKPTTAAGAFFLPVPRNIAWLPVTKLVFLLPKLKMV